MAANEDRIHAFVVRIWLEPREMQDATPIWRGTIEHVGDEHRQSFQDLAEVETFIQGYLKKMGARIRTPSWAAKWMKRATQHLRK